MMASRICAGGLPTTRSNIIGSFCPPNVPAALVSCNALLGGCEVYVRHRLAKEHHQLCSYNSWLGGGRPGPGGSFSSLLS
jgi:hypothetical protein